METNSLFCHPVDEFLKYSIDWISVINDNISYDEMCLFFHQKNIKFDERYFMNNKYLVIGKESYSDLLHLMIDNNDFRITRIDVKCDFKNDFEGVVLDGIALWEPYSSVSKGGKLQTLYFNSRQSDMFCRLYDKQAESDLDFPLTRLEFEIKGDIAYEFSKRLCYIGLDDAVNFIYSKINEFCKRKSLNHLFHITTKAYLPFEVIERKTIKNKFRRFVHHNTNSYSRYMEYFNLSPHEFDEIMTGNVDLEEFLRSN